MNVLIITRSFVREVSYFARYVAHSGFSLNLSLVMPHSTKLEEPLPASMSFRKIYFSQRMRAACYAPSLFADIRKFRPDILHLFEEYSGIIVFQALLFNRLLGRKSKVMVYSAENLRNNMSTMFQLSRRYVTRRSDLAFVCSHSVKQVLAAEGFSKPIEVFPLGVDTIKFSKFSVEGFKKELKLEQKFVVGYVGRLLGIKGVFLLIDMMRYLPEDVHLVMVGTGPEEPRLRRAATEYGLSERIHLFGDVPYPDLPRYINCLDIGIVPSITTKRWKEQFGRVITEFMSCEVPVIGSDSGSIPEVIGNAGCIFHENDLQALVNAVNVLRLDHKKRHELGKFGRERATRLYSIEMMCERFLTMYQRLM